MVIEVGFPFLRCLMIHKLLKTDDIASQTAISLMVKPLNLLEKSFYHIQVRLLGMDGCTGDGFAQPGDEFLLVPGACKVDEFIHNGL
jgi:hypothetical protein